MVKKYTGIVIAKWDKNKVKNYTGTCILHCRRLKYEAPCIEFQVCASRTLVMDISVRLKIGIHLVWGIFPCIQSLFHNFV